MAGALIGALRVSLSAETTAFEAGMNRSQAIAKRTAANMNTAFSGTGKILERTALRFAEVLTLAAVYRAGKAALEYAGHLGELADTLGLTTRDLQTFSYAAGQVGISQEELQTGIQKLTISMGQAEAGAKKQITAFNAIGISVDDLKDKNAGDVFRLIADKLQNVSDRSQRAAIEVALFGKAGAKMDNLLSGAQGRLNDLSDAAERLGIVLSDEQIRKADETADKLEALKTVLKAQIAGVVADNSDAILGLANALLRLSSSIPQAIKGWQLLRAEFSEPITLHDLFGGGGGVLGAMERGAKRFADQQRVQAFHDRLTDSLAGRGSPKLGGNIGQFLAPSGGGGGKGRHASDDLERKQLDAQRKAYDFQRTELDAQKDILDAKKDLSEDYIEQSALSIQILNLERQQYKADLDNQVAENAITKGKEGISQAQADHLLALYDEADHDKRMKVINDEREQALRDSGELDDRFIERKIDLLQKQEDLATTQSERRKIELDILELTYQEKKQALQRILDNSKDTVAIENARRDLADLNKNYALDRQAVNQRTQSPLENYFSQIPHTADQINEALQNIEVQGIDGLTNALSQAGQGWGAMRDAALQSLQEITSALIRLGIQRMLFNLFGSAIGGGGGFDSAGLIAGNSAALAAFPRPGGFASGGAFKVGGVPGVDRNMLSINGKPRAMVSADETIAVIPRHLPGMKHGGFLGSILPFVSPFAAIAFKGGKFNPLALISPFAALASKTHDPLALLSPGLALAGAFDGHKKGSHTFNINVTAPNTGNPAKDRQTSLQQAADIRLAVAGAAAKGLI